MRLSPTLSVYFARTYLAGIGIVFLALLVLAFTLDAVELLRRASGRPEATFGLVLQMALLKLPSLSQQLLPFAMLFGGMMTLTRLTRTHELTVTRAAGISVWQFLAPALAATFLIGAFAIAIYNPVASALLSRYEQIESKVLRGRTSMLAVSGTGLWLRDADASGQVVVHALRTAQQGIELYDAIFFFYEGNDRFVRRIDAALARLEPEDDKSSHWQLENALITGPDQPASFLPRYRIPTRLTPGRIQDSFASPETLSFWELPAFISTLETTGFSAVRHRLHLHSTIAVPFLLCAMVLIAAPFSLRLTRRGGTGLMLAGGVLAGFAFYFISRLTSALGLSADVPVVLAAWSPTAISAFLGLAMLFHLEDG